MNKVPGTFEVNEMLVDVLLQMVLVSGVFVTMAVG